MKATRCIVIAVSLVLAWSVLPQLEAQVPLGSEVPGMGTQPVQVDHAAFQGGEPGMIRLEVYYKIYNFGLTFERQGDKWNAEYELLIAVEDDKANAFGTHTSDKTITVLDEERTKSHFDFRTSQINFDVPVGEYHLRFTLRDGLGARVYNYDAKLKLGEFKRKQPSFSDVQFARHIERADSDSSVFAKGGLLVIPSVSREYEGEENSRLLYYMELYRGESDADKVVVETIIRNDRKGMVYRDTLTTHLGAPVERQLREISSAEFPSGNYEMEIVLRGRRNKKLDRQRQKFQILWSQRALLRHDFNTAMDQLSLMANSSAEVKQMRKLKTVEERIRAFDEFWLVRDPTVGTPENEVKREFYRRVQYANEHFRSLQLDGWRSDRGRVYIMYGEPDQIDDYPMSLSYLPYQIWHYYKKGTYRRFLFVDENLDGDYRLQYPYDGLNQTPDF